MLRNVLTELQVSLRNVHDDETNSQDAYKTFMGVAESCWDSMEAGAGITECDTAADRRENRRSLVSATA